MGNMLHKPKEAEAGQKEEEQRDEFSNFTCEICVEPMLSNRKFKNGSLCVHPFCLDCISKYIDIKVEGAIGNIECPGLSCSHLLDTLSCKPIISKPVFVKWCDLLCESTVLGFDRCYCPYRDCSTLVLDECKVHPRKVRCPNCRRNFCFRCKIPWHSGYGCNESGQLRDMNDVLVGELIEEKRWTRCYNCGHSVERVSGCRDIKCKCGVRFCHQCGGRYHLGPCKHKCCGDVFFFICFMAMMVAIGYLFFHQVDLQSSSTTQT